MSLIEMSQQHRATPAKPTFALDFNTNNEYANSSNDRITSDLVGSGIPTSTDHVTPTRRYDRILLLTYCVLRSTQPPTLSGTGMSSSSRDKG